jgi:hypothetical protein
MMAPSYLEVGASGKPGAVQLAFSCISQIGDPSALIDGRIANRWSSWKAEAWA